MRFLTDAVIDGLRRMHVDDVIGGRFELDREVGRGGMGTVYRAYDLVTGGVVALKLLREEGASDAQRFAAEAKILEELRHPHVVEHVAHGITEDGEHYLAIEWLEGESLSQRLRREELSVPQAITLARVVAGALGAAHARGIVHRDVKPSNLFLHRGDVTSAKVLDFGIARLASGWARITRTGELVGTPGYMAPEQARRSRDLDPRADVFSLGCVLYRCVTGRDAFEGDDVLSVLAQLVLDEPVAPRELVRDLPDELDWLIRRMLAKSPADRPRDGAHVAAELAAIEALEDGTAYARRRMTPPAFSAITTEETRLSCVVIAGAPSTVGLDGVDSASYAALRTAIAQTGSELSILADGSLLVCVAPEGTATDQATLAVRAAIAIQCALPRASIAVAAVRAIPRATRLLGEAAPGVIRLDDAVAGLVRGSFEIAMVDGGAILAGDRAGLETPRTLLGKATPCVGREQELALCGSIFEVCRSEPEARAVLITAPAGFGKSRLRQEVLSRLDGEVRPVVWLGRGDAVSAGAPFGLIAPLLRRLCGIRDDEPLERRRNKLDARVGQRVAPSERERITEFLAELVGAPFPNDASVRLRAARSDVMLMGDQVRRAWEDFVEAELSAGPIALVLEDIHYGDLPSLKLVDAALRRLHDRPLFVLALGRPDVDDRFPKLWSERGVDRIQLAGLRPKPAERLVRAVLGDDIDSGVVDDLVRRAGGNAFYLEELIRAVGGGQHRDLPETVLAMVQSRLEAQEPQARRVLRAASVFGRVFWAGAVAALVGGTEGGTSVAGHLVKLCEAELMTRRYEGKFAQDTELAFGHDLLREAAYATLTEDDRRLGHRLAADWLEAAGEPDPLVLADHRERAGEPGRAIAFYHRAAEHALEGNDFASAVERARRAIACGAVDKELGSLHLLQAEALKWLGQTNEAASAAQSAMSYLPRGGADWCTAAGEVALTYARRGDTDELRATAEELLTEARSGRATDDAATAAASARVAVSLSFAGSYELAEALVEVADAAATRCGPDPVAHSWLTAARAHQALVAGEPARYLELLSAFAVYLDQSGETRRACNNRINVGYAYNELGAFERGAEVSREALVESERMGLRFLIASSKHNLGRSLVHLGGVDEALRLDHEVIEEFRTQGDRRAEGGARVYHASALLVAGRSEEALSEARAAVELLEAAPPYRGFALAVLADIELRSGDLQSATRHAAEARALLDKVERLEEGEALVRLVHAETLHANGELDEARAAIDVARRRLLARADKIEDRSLRESFLTRVPENRRTLELAVAWGIA